MICHLQVKPNRQEKSHDLLRGMGNCFSWYAMEVDLIRWDDEWNLKDLKDLKVQRLSVDRGK